MVLAHSTWSLIIVALTYYLKKLQLFTSYGQALHNLNFTALKNLWLQTLSVFYMATDRSGQS